MSKYIHRAKTLPAIPMDYWERFDASTSEGMTFNTDEATGDVSTWDGQCGRALLTKLVSGNYPIWTPGQVYFDGDSGLQDLTLGAPFDAALDCTVVMAMNFDSPTGTNYMYYGPPFTVVYNNGLSDKVLWSGGLTGQTAEDLLNTDIVVGLSNEHVGTDDNTKTYYLGTTEIASNTGYADASAFINLLRLGYYSTSGNAAIGNFYEILVYDRLLSSGEYEAVCNYLSNKWSAQNSDTASADIETAPEIVDDIPLYYYDRWDASTSDGMTFNTDEATGDIVTWTGQMGRLTLSSSYATGQPIWDTGSVTFTSGNAALRSELTAPDFEDNARAVFISCTIDAGNSVNSSAFAGPEAFIRLEHDGATDVRFSYNDGTATNVAPTNSLEATRIAFGYSTDDSTVVNWWWGANSKSTDTLGTWNEGLNYLYVGAANNTASLTMNGTVNEVIVYDRHLSDAEAEKVLNYLSGKWSAQNEDSASSVIYSGSTTRNNLETWTNTNIDKEGEGSPIFRSPGSQPGEYSIVRVGDRDAIHLDPNFPMTLGSVTYWFSGEQFTSAPGTDVTSWTDRTGNLTLGNNPGALTDPSTEVIFGKRAVYCDGSEGLQQDANITHANSTSGVWVMYVPPGATLAGGTRNTCIQTLGNVHQLCYAGASYTGGAVCGFHSRVDYGGNPDAHWYTPAFPYDTRGRIVVYGWRSDDTATTGYYEPWFWGLQGPAQQIQTNTGTSYGLSIGCDNAGNNPMSAYVFEMFETGQILSDANMESLIRFFCEKYDVDFIPEDAPMNMSTRWTVGSTVPAFAPDLCKWYRSDKNLNETAWGLHPKCAEFYTAPAGYSMKQITDPADVTVDGGRKESSTTVASQTLLSGGYDYTETTDFPAMDGGATFGAVSFADSTLTTSSRAWSLGGLTSMMQWNSGGSLPAAIYVGNRSFPSLGDADAWNCFIGRHWFDDDGSGTPDGDPHTKWHKNDDTGSDDASAITTFGTIKTAVHGEVTTTNAAANSRVRELWSWKHPLNDREVANLQKYVAYRYPDMKALLGL